MAPSDPIDSPVPEPWDSGAELPKSTKTSVAGSATLAKTGPDSLVGTTVSDRYKLLSVLGEGGMGAVYLAEHTLMRKRVAIKVLHPEMSHMPEVVARFEREAMAAAHIDHPNVATATDFGKLPDGGFFLALELLEGQSLREVLAGGKLPVARALGIVRQIAQGLVRAHGLGIVHRDLKPENVMLVEREGEKDVVKVLDFGIAKVPVGELAKSTQKGEPGAPVLTQAGMVYGTPEYMAPEQALGQDIDARADMYALGVMMFEMLCGARPFEDESKIRLLGMHVTAPIPKMADKGGADVPPEVEEVVRRLLSKEASDRTPDAKTLLEQLDGLFLLLVASGRVEGGALPTAFRGTAPSLSRFVPTPPPEPAQPAPKGLPISPRQQAIVAGGAAVVVLLVVVMALALGGKKPPASEADATPSGLVSAPTSASSAPQDGDDPAAIIELDPLAPEPPVVDPKIKEGLAALEAGQTEKAVAILAPYAEKRSCPSQVHRALMTAYKDSDPKKAIVHARKLVERRPQERSAIDVLVTVRNLALGENAAENEAFALLASGLGASGPDVLYDMAFGDYAKDYTKAAKRAQGLLKQTDVRSKGNAALGVALDLRATLGTCEMRKYVDRAGEAGDKRALAVLQLVPSKAAKKKAAYPSCVRGEAFDKAVAAIESRQRDGG